MLTSAARAPAASGAVNHAFVAAVSTSPEGRPRIKLIPVKGF